MATGTLYTYPNNFRATKALVAAQYSGFKITVSPNFVFGETNKSEAFLKKFPLGKVPAFETNDGKVLTDSNAIAYFVANDSLRGTSEQEKAQIIQWMGFAENEVLPLSCTLVFPILGIMQYNKQAVEQAKLELNRVLAVVNDYLLPRTFLVGERVTLADIVLASTLMHLYENYCDEKNRKPFVNLNRWFLTCVNQPQFKAVIGDFKLCDKEGQVDPKKFSEFQSRCGGTKSDDKKVAKEKKKEEKKKEEKPKPAKEAEPAEELDAAEEALLAEPKSKDPFDEMPKGTFNFEDFKRFYSNNDEAKSIPYFWEKFDKENYSIWFGEYKYPEELTKVFMSCNLITGMYQRLDKMRKQCFASVCLFGSDNDSTISGVWVWRGQNLAFELSPDWQVDYETYDWKKLDPDSDETKKMVADYFSWTGTDKNGRPFNQGKIFK